MRKIDPVRFQIATQGTSREINRQIVLNLVRANQPISRADLARTMGVRRGSVSLIVSDLLQSGLIVEGATGKTVRGRKPTFLYIDSRRRTVVAVDIRASQTYLMPADLLGKPLSGVVGFPTVRDPKAAGRDARRSDSRAARRPWRRRRLRRRWRGDSRDDRALDDARAARADARVAERRRARPADDGDRPAGADRELRPGVRAGAAVGDARRHVGLGWRLRVRQRVGRPRPRRDRPRRGAARPAQRRRRVRPRAADDGRPALFVRRHRLLGSLCLEPRDAGPVFRPAGGV